MLRPRNFDFFEEVLSECDQPETPFQGLDRASLIQEAKRFSAATINVKSCASTLIKLLYLLGQGETLSATEATEIFFGVTKLFQADNAALRRLMYVALKELSPMVEQAFVASAQLVKDIHSSNDMYRAHAIRTLRKITDASTLTPFERYLKQAIVDKSSCVAGAALVTALHLSYQPETVGMVRRWTSEVAEALKHRSAKVQFAALALMHRLRNADRLSVTRLVQTVQQGPVRSPLAVTLLLRLVTDLVRDDAKLVSGGCKLSGGSSLPSSSTSATPISQNRNPELIAFLTSCLRHSNDCVVFEAARGLVAIHPVITPKELTPVILVLHMYLTARRPLVQFGAIRILSHVATVYPSLVGPCTGDLENLIQDSNRNIATMAVMTLLRSGSENSLEKLLKEATLFMSDLDEDFRCVVIEAVSDLSQKHPARYPVILQFLSDALRSESGLTYKRTVLEAILRLAMAIPDAHVLAVSSVADFIQDCEYPVLTARVVHFLGEVGPMSDTPNRCLRHVFNRILLETPLVRSAAVSAVGKFAAQNRTTSKKPTSCEMIPGSTVRDLIQQVMLDPDDEVRDRALLVYQTVGGHDVPGCDGEEAVQVCHVLNEIQHKARQRLLSFRKNKTLSFSAKDSQCLNATRDTQPTSALTAPFNEEQLPPNRLEIPEALKACVASVEAASFLTELYSTNRIFPNSPLGSFLEPFYVTDPMLLTEPDSEYVVRVVRYVYPHAVLLHFSVTNTMEEQWIVRPSISVELDPVEEEDDEGSTQFPRAHIKIPNPVPFVALEKPWLCPNQTGSIFAFLRIDQPSSKTLHTPNANVSRALLPPTCTIQSTLHFALSEESPENSREAHRTAHAEQYPLDACSLTVADYLRPWTPTTTPAACNSRPELEVFQQLWETMGEQGQTGGTYVLPDTSGLHTVQAAVQRVVTFYGIHVVGGPKNLPSDSSTLVSHMLHLSGSYLTPTLSPQGEVRPVLIRCRIFISKERLIALEINIRGLDETLRSFLIEELL